MSQPRRSLRTIAVHAGEPRPSLEGAISMPIFQSSTFVLGDPGEFDDIRYIRLNNTPNHEAVGAKLAALEGTEAAIVGPSGTAAISMTLQTLLAQGDHLLAQERVYGGTRKVLDALAGRQGIEVSYVPFEAVEPWREALRPNTRAIYVESLTNPLLEIGPLDEAAAFARAHGLVSVIDNTFASPVVFRPAELGFDLVLHSASKYLNGHSDLCAGVVAGDAARIEAVRRTMNLAGVCLDPHACSLLQRGLKTLPLRVPAQNAGALVLARALERHPKVRRVHYPGLASDPGHRRACRWFEGFGAIVTLALRGEAAMAERLIAGLTLAQPAPSLGGVESLVCRPETTSHAGLPEAVRLRMGVGADLVRVSVGIEDPEELVADFLGALDAA